MLDAIALRMNFDNAVTLLQREGIDPTKARLTQSYLRAEVLASTSVTTYDLPFLVNRPDANNFNTARKLQLQDAFVATQIGLFVAVPGSSTATNFPLFTYGDIITFSTANTSTSLNSLYNGFMQVTLNNNVILPGWDLLRHFKAPWQQTQAAIASVTGARQNSFDWSEDGFYPVEPSLVVNGAGNYQASLVLPSALAAVETNQRIIVIMRGVLAQNVTSVQ